jgi:hypothetical protein
VAADQELPLVHIASTSAPGTISNPRQGELTDLTGYLLARGGTKSMTAEDLGERLPLAADLKSHIGESDASVSLNHLWDLDEGMAILAVPRARFQDKFVLRKQQLLQGMKRRNATPPTSKIARRAFSPMAKTSGATAKYRSVRQRRDPRRRRVPPEMVSPANFIVAASGGFDRAAMIKSTNCSTMAFTGETAPGSHEH